MFIKTIISRSVNSVKSFSTRSYTREEIFLGLNDRLLMNRRTERLGLRRCLLACGCFLLYKFVTSRVLGTSNGTQSRSGGIRREDMR